MNKRKKEQLVIFFQKELGKWANEKEQEHWYLKMRLVNLVSNPVSFGSNAFWERVVNLILIKAEAKNISPRQVIENLFDQEDSEKWIVTLETLNK